MTEDDWLTCRTRPMEMFRFARTRAGRRKLHLLSCACCRLLWNEFPDWATEQICRSAILAAERYADGECSEQEFTDRINEVYTFERMIITRELADDLAQVATLYATFGTVARDVIQGLEETLQWINAHFSCSRGDDEPNVAIPLVREQICDRFREILGNPFRLWTVNPSWLGGGLTQPDGRVVPITSDVRNLAEMIDREQAFDRLPILADAVEEAGFDDRDLLDHLRVGNGHFRGCWALDILLECD